VENRLPSSLHILRDDAPSPPSSISEPRSTSSPDGRDGAPLADRYNRPVRYLRLSVTDRCDLRCVYCMPEGGNPTSERAEVLSIEETVRAVAVFRRLGVQTVRITGGEPLVRRGVVEMVRGISAVGIEDVALSTNATQLAPLAAPLREAGVRRVNISLDTLRADRLLSLSRRGAREHDGMMRGIEAAVSAGFEERKLNTVLLRGLNDDEAEDIVRFAWAHGFTPRFIELMPIGEGAELFAQGRYFGNDELRLRLAHLLDESPETRRADRGPARYVAARANVAKGREIGFISAMSHNFCEGCNRVRLSAKGELRPCLASPRGVSLRDRMRGGEDDASIARAVRAALDGKEESHHFLDAGRDDHHHVTMSGIGG